MTSDGRYFTLEGSLSPLAFLCVLCGDRFFYLLDLPAAVCMLPMRLAAVLRRAGALLHSIVAHHRGHTQPVIGEHPAAPFCLRHSMPREIAPSANRLVVAPERQGQILALCGQACEALDRYESIDPSIFSRSALRAAARSKYSAARPSAGHTSKITAIMGVSSCSSCGSVPAESRKAQATSDRHS
jgi:hypothetical protein